MHRAELADEFRCSFWANPFYAGNMIAGIAHQSHHIDHLIWSHAKFLLHFFNTKPFVFHGIEHANIRTYQLHHVLIPANDDNLKTFLRRFLCQRSDDVIRFKTRYPDAMNVIGLHQRFKVRELFCQIFRRCIPIGFVVLIHLVTERLFFTVKGYRQVIRLLILHYLLQHMDEPIQGVGGKPCGCGQKLSDTKKGPKNIGRTIYQIEGFSFAHNSPLSVKMLDKYKVAALPCLINCVNISTPPNYELIELKGLY